MSQEFDAEKYYMKSSPFGITDREIELYGMCLENSKVQCHDSCPKFMKRQCNGAIIIRQAGGTTWISRGWFRLRDGRMNKRIEHFIENLVQNEFDLFCLSVGISIIIVG